MCLHNAKRETLVTQAIPVRHEAALQFWNPLTGDFDDQPGVPSSPVLTRKTARGWVRQRGQAKGGGVS